MDRQCYVRQQLELLSSPTTIQYHRIETYSSVVEGVRRIRRILGNEQNPESDCLIRACARNDFDAARWLLDQTESPAIDLKRGINRSALHEAVLHENGQLLVRLLCRYGADTKQSDSLGRTPFHYAASYGHIDVLKELLSYSRVSISSITDMEGRCPLMYACGQGHIELCRWLIEEADADYLRNDNRGRSCLSYACRSGHEKLVEWLIPLIPATPTITGWYPLHLACFAGNLDTVRILISSDSHSPNVVTNTGHSTLFMAMHTTKNSREITECLLDSSKSVHLTAQDVEDLYCDQSLILLFVQRRHSISYFMELLEHVNDSRLFLTILLLSEHSFTWKQLESQTEHQSMINYRRRNALTLKQIARCFIRKSLDTSKRIDSLWIHDSLKKFLRFQSLV